MPNLKLSCLTVGKLAVNCWFLANEDTKEAVVFDPGDEPEKIAAYAEEKGWEIKAILLTHGHADHIGGADALRKRCGAFVCALREEESMLQNAKTNLSIFINRKSVTLTVDEPIKDGQELFLAGVALKALHTPGHTPGGCSYYCEEAGCVFSGDTLFRESVGRSDFPGGSMSQLVRSVKDILFALPEGTRVCPGHGEETTIAYEKKYNPFV